MADVNLGALASTTLRNYRNEMIDNIFLSDALLSHRESNGGIEKLDGGRQVVVPLMYGTNSTVMAFSGTDNLDLTYQGGIDAAVYDWKYYNVSVVFTKEDELKNKGRSAVLSLLKAKIRQAELSIRERLSDDQFNGASSNSKEITGLDTAVDTGTYGSIAGATYTWWNSYEENTATALSISAIRVGVNTCNLGAGGSKVSIIPTTQTLHQKYESLLTTDINYNVTSTKEMKRLGDAGFYNLGFRGIPVIIEESCTSGELFFLNMDNLKLTFHKDAYFDVIDKAEPADQHVSVQHIMFSAEQTINRRKSLGKLTAKSAT
jgi:hypothetical protein